MLKGFDHRNALQRYFSATTSTPHRKVLDPARRTVLRVRTIRDVRDELEQLNLGIGAMIMKRILSDMEDEEEDENNEAEAKRAKRE